LVLGNGKHIPFPDRSFDGVFCGCVFPHVGVIGDSTRVAPDCWQQRLELAREMTRVLKPGGKILVSSPNRLFPLDIFHGRKPGSYRPRWNWPVHRFLLSVGDYDRLFRVAGCARGSVQPVAGYWGFIRSRNSIKGRLLGVPLRALFRVVSTPGLRFLAGSPANPWIVVLLEKPPLA
jgi:SAM-dependent methyltransferase